MRPTTPFTPWLDWLDDQFEAMLANSIRLARLESGMANAVAVNRVGEWVRDRCRELGAVSEVFALSSATGTFQSPCVFADPQGNEQPAASESLIRLRQRPEAARQMLLVLPLRTAAAQDPFQAVSWLEDDEILRGPGVARLNGGIMVMIKALQALERTPWASQIGWELLLIPDGEQPSAATAAFITDASTQHQLMLGFAPVDQDKAALRTVADRGDLQGWIQQQARSLGIWQSLPQPTALWPQLALPQIGDLGVVGGKIGQPEEYLQVISLVERAKLSALIMINLAAAGELSWLEETDADYKTAQFC